MRSVGSDRMSGREKEGKKKRTRQGSMILLCFFRVFPSRQSDDWIVQTNIWLCKFSKLRIQKSSENECRMNYTIPQALHGNEREVTLHEPCSEDLHDLRLNDTQVGQGYSSVLLARLSSLPYTLARYCHF